MTSASCPCCCCHRVDSVRIFFYTFFSIFFSFRSLSLTHRETHSAAQAEGVSLVRQIFSLFACVGNRHFLCATLSSHCTARSLSLPLSRSLVRSLQPRPWPHPTPHTLATNLRIRKNVGCALALSLTPLLCVCALCLFLCVRTNGGFVDTKK